MARLYDARNIAWGSTGLLLSGARLYTFDSVSITTPKATYADNALSTSNGPYVQADSSGVFPPIYGAANELYYCVLKDSDGNVIDEIPDVAMLGPDSTSTLLKDLGANGRFQVSGDAGVVQVETGNAVGDDIGGSGRIGGWGGTQGDALELDYAAITATGTIAATGNISTTGDLSSTGGGVTLAGIAQAVPRALVRSSASAVASVDIAIDGAYEAWEIHLRNIVWTSNGSTFDAQFSFDNGATYKAGASEYQYAHHYTTNATPAGAQAAAATMKLAPDFISVPASAIIGGDMVIRVTSKSGRSARLDTKYNMPMGTTTISNLRVGIAAGVCQTATYGKADHIRISTNVGTLTFDYVVIGLP